MKNNSQNQNGVSLAEFNSVRQNVKLLQAQIESGRVDGQFLTQQIHKLDAFLNQLEQERQQTKQDKQFEALYNVSRILGSSLDLPEVLNQVMDAVIELTGAERGFLMLRDHDGGLNVVAARNFDQQTVDSTQSRYSRTIANTVLDKGAAVLTTNASEDPRFSGQDSISAQSLRSIMATPLRARGEVIGVAYVDSRITSDLFEQSDLNALEALTGQAAMAIENARLFEQTDQELASTVTQLTQLRRIDRLLNETLDPDKAMQFTLDWAAYFTDAIRGYLGLVQSASTNIPTIHTYGEVDNRPDFLDDVYPTIGQVIQDGASVTDVISVDGQSQSVLMLPIMRDVKVVGAVVLHKADTTPFTHEQVDLAGRVVNRAAVTIENAQLYTAVQAADRAKSEFVGIVAHDLKVPMNSIMGYASLTQLVGEDEGNLIGRQAEFLDKIIDTVKRMEVLVDDLADVSRIESGHFYMDPMQVPVSQILGSVKDNTLLEIQNRGHEFVIDTSPNLPDMWVDYYRLLQILTNLVSNAYKYTPNNGKIILGVSLVGDRICFKVQDTGIGLSQKQIAMLGTKFWRAEDDYTRSQPGSGLGFAITAKLVELMGSHIKIESAPGRGSTFSFSVETVQNLAETS